MNPVLTEGHDDANMPFASRDAEGIGTEDGDKKPLRSSPEIGDGVLYN
jgi:hypothetical protein